MTWLEIGGCTAAALLCAWGVMSKRPGERMLTLADEVLWPLVALAVAFALTRPVTWRALWALVVFVLVFSASVALMGGGL